MMSLLQKTFQGIYLYKFQKSKKARFKKIQEFIADKMKEWKYSDV